MIREIELLPTGEISDSGFGSTDSRDPNTSPYPNAGSPTKTLAEVWSDEDNASYWYHWPGKDAGGLAVVLASWQAAPTLVLIRSVKLRALWDYSQSGPNNWFFPGDNTFGPRARLVIRNRAGSGNLYSSYYEIAGADIVDRNQNINTGSPGTYLGPLTQEWELLSHPEGGPFTLDDLSVAKFAAGIEIQVDAPAYINSQGSFFKVRVPKVRVILTVEDLGGYVDNVRHATSLSLRLMRRARNVVKPTMFAHRAVGDVGEVVYLSHPRGPSVLPGGWGTRRLERRAGLVLKRTYHPESFKVEDEILDLRPYACLAWAVYRIDGPWSPELQGLAYLDKGGGYTHARAQDAWSPRPGDGVLMRVLEDYPDLSFHGLAAHGGGDVAICTRNYDLMQAGWSTVGAAGDFAVTASTTVAMAEEQGYLTSALLTYGAGGGKGGREQDLGTLDYNAGDYVHVRVIVRNSSVPTPATQFLEVQLYRSGGSLPATEYWSEALRSWTTTVTNNPIPSDEPSGEVVFDAIPTDAPLASSDPTYKIRVGRFSSNLVSCSFHGAIVDVQKGGATWGGSYGARSPLITLDAEITRVADVHRITNSATAAAEVWSYERGLQMFEGCPYWRAEALLANVVKPLLHARHAADTYDALQFVAKTGSDDLVRFERAVSGQATFRLDCPIPSLDLTRAHVLRAWVRYLGADGWVQFGPYSVEVGYAIFLEADGSLLSSGSALGTLAYTGNVATREWVGIGNDDTPRYFDGYVRTWETRRNPMAAAEVIWKL